MSQRGSVNFHPLNSTEPSFNSTLGNASVAYALASTLRVFQGPSGRAVRVASKASDDYSIALGSSNIVATSSGGILILGGTVETFWLSPSQSHIAVVSSTDVEVNITPGYGQ